MKVLGDLDSLDVFMGKGGYDDLGGATKKRTPFITVCTDLGGASRSWFEEQAECIIVPSDQLKSKAIESCKYFNPDYDVEKVRKIGLPIRDEFNVSDVESEIEASSPSSVSSSSSAFLSSLGFASPSKGLVLIVGGGDGMGNIIDVSNAVVNKLGDGFNVAVICGSNEDAEKSLKRRHENNGNVKVYGYVTNMSSYMKSTSLLITKAGPGTIAEASSLALPTVLMSFVPGQEEGNVDYVKEGGWGVYADDPSEVAREAERILTLPTDDYREMRRLAYSYSNPTASSSIADVILSYATSRINVGLTEGFKGDRGRGGREGDSWIRDRFRGIVKKGLEREEE